MSTGRPARSRDAWTGPWRRTYRGVHSAVRRQRHHTSSNTWWPGLALFANR